MLKKSGLIICLMLTLLFVGQFLFVEQISADSGWDSSYSSGGSSSSSSSGSSWSGSSSSSSSSSGGSFNNTEFFEMPFYIAIFMELFCSIHYFVFVFRPLGNVFSSDKKKAMKIALILFFIRVLFLVVMDIISPSYAIIDFILLFLFAFMVVPVCSVFKSKDKSGDILDSKSYFDIADSVLTNYGITNKADFKFYLYDKFVDIQTSWMNFDNHSLNNLLTDELYNMYSSQLDILKSKGQKNIMSDFEFVDAKILNIYEQNGILNLKLFLNVKMYDYVVDYYNKTVRGSDNKKIDIKYEIIFQKSIDKNLDVCPNCGAKLSSDNLKICSYCNSTIVENSNDWIMSKKTCISQD